MAKNALDWIVLILVRIGGLNLGIAGFGYNVIERLLGAGSLITNIIYWLIGLAALYTIWIAIKK